MDPKEASRWMALDVGERTIGVALSDPLKVVVRPLLSIRRKSLREDCSELAGMMETHSVSRLIVGLPVHLGGEPSDIQRRIVEFVQHIEKETGIPVDWQDERLSTRRAEELMAVAGVPVSQRRKKRDAFAAAVILEWYIEEHRQC